MKKITNTSTALDNIRAMVFEWDRPDDQLTEYGQGAANLARKVLRIISETLDNSVDEAHN